MRPLFGRLRTWKTRRNRSPGSGLGAPTEAPPAPFPADPAKTLVALATEHWSIGDAVERLLGADFRVVIGSPDGAAVAVLTPVTAVDVRRRYPRIAILVVEPRPEMSRSSAVTLLDAGVDDYLASASPSEIAARIRALLRRRARSTL